MTAFNTLLILFVFFLVIQFNDEQNSQINQLAIQFGCEWEGHGRGLGHTYSWHLVCKEAPK